MSEDRIRQDAVFTSCSETMNRLKPKRTGQNILFYGGNGRHGLTVFN